MKEGPIHWSRSGVSLWKVKVLELQAVRASVSEYFTNGERIVWSALQKKKEEPYGLNIRKQLLRI